MKKKFILLAHGEMDSTPEGRQAHQAWWESMRGHVIDSGNPLINGRDVTRAGEVAALGPASDPALGYSLIEAESWDEAVALLAGCPMDMWVYEAVPM
ncbi:hypothetical protein P0L94_16105 [Microbacter sp. GSS18]|nr:hypothetical protein P0L94_16105 [Microbacter sp. GSS18]